MICYRLADSRIVVGKNASLPRYGSEKLGEETLSIWKDLDIYEYSMAEGNHTWVVD
jgi:hypothetical protein